MTRITGVELLRVDLLAERLAAGLRPKFVYVIPDYQNPTGRTLTAALGILTALTHRLRRTDDLLRHRVSRNANEEEEATLTVADRAADLIAEFGGSWKFIGASIAFSLFWIMFNTWFLFRPFDEYPYVLLNLVLGMVAGLQAPIIMMSQNRQGQKDRLRADLDYRVNLKNELLLSEVLRRLEAIEERRAHRPDEEIEFRPGD